MPKLKVPFQPRVSWCCGLTLEISNFMADVNKIHNAVRQLSRVNGNVNHIDDTRCVAVNIRNAGQYLINNPNQSKLIIALASTKASFDCAICEERQRITRQLAFSGICVVCAEYMVELEKFASM